MSKNITPRSENGEKHGYWEKYFSNNQLYYKGNYVNGKRNGYCEEYYSNGQLWYKGSYVNGEKQGPFEFYYDNGQLNYKGYYDMNVKVDYAVDIPNDDLIFEVI